MSAFYTMNYLGGTGIGAGALYIGKGTIVGADVAGGRYQGTYREEGGRILADITLSMPQGGVLVTGQQIPAGARIPLKANWPSAFANGDAMAIAVPGGTVSVTLQKVGDVP